MKKCKGTHKDTYGMGCGQLVEKRTLGLGHGCKCYNNFLFGTDAGKLRIGKATLRASKKVKKEKRTELRKEKLKTKRDLMSPDKYRAKVVQPVINEIARLIDHGCPCIATGSFDGKHAGGHYISVGSNRTLALNLHNIHRQSFHSNGWNGGDDKRYQEGIKNTYGQDYLDFLNGLKRQRPIKLSKDELEKVHKKALELKKEMKKDLKWHTPSQRIYLRNSVNIHLGIYDEEFKIFKIKELVK